MSIGLKPFPKPDDPPPPVPENVKEAKEWIENFRNK